MTRVHIVCLPHTLLTREYDYCAYTAKCRRFVDMLARADIHALVYGPDIADSEVHALSDDYVTIVDEDDRQRWFGAPEWPRSRVFDRWDINDVAWTTTNQRAADAIRERWQPGDILGIIGGLCQKQIVESLADLHPLVCECGIGYSGVVPGTHRVYESYAWLHHVAGFYREDDMRFFDDVIPNCFDLNDFDFSATQGEYLLYMGRPNPRKGLKIVEEIAKRVDIPVLIAGQPGEPIPGTQYIGLITGDEKKKVLAGARALLTPTVYLEPFGGVAVEAMLSGTPVIATDYGAFTETVIPGLTGFRCRQLVDFLDAADEVSDIDRHAVRAYAESHWTLEVGSRLYGNYLTRLETLYTDGWYAGADAFQPL